jgi:hypothetical protein
VILNSPCTLCRNKYPLWSAFNNSEESPYEAVKSIFESQQSLSCRGLGRSLNRGRLDLALATAPATSSSMLSSPSSAGLWLGTAVPSPVEWSCWLEAGEAASRASGKPSILEEAASDKTSRFRPRLRNCATRSRRSQDGLVPLSRQISLGVAKKNREGASSTEA